MKILYIVPKINNGDGIARVLSIKANYLVEKWNYDITFLTQNNGNFPLFFDFDNKIKFEDSILKGNLFQFFNTYRKELKSKIILINPDVIIVADNGLKAYLIPFILKKKIPLVLEIHSSLYVEENKIKRNVFSKILTYLKYKFKKWGANKYDKIVVETPASIEEWDVKNGIVIPNPLWFSTDKVANLQEKKVIAVARHTYEKGLDRMLQVWQKVIEKHPDWILDIYGKSTENLELQKLAQSLNISSNVNFLEPVKDIETKYPDYSFYLMTSRYEGFGMVLIEAMACGLPCIAYDCPCGPRTIITNNKDGFLIQDENENEMIQNIFNLIENEKLGIELGTNAKERSKDYEKESIMKKWKQLFDEM